MDVHHQNFRLVWLEGRSVDQSCFNENRYVLDGEFEVVMEFMKILPPGALFWHLIDFPTRRNEFMHQPLDLSVLQGTQVSFDPSLGVFLQLETNITAASRSASVKRATVYPQ